MAPSLPKQRAKLPLVRWLRKGRVFIILAIAALALAVTHLAWFQELGFIKRWEAQAYDIRFQQRGPQPPHPRIAIAGITGSSFDQKLLEVDMEESRAIALMHQAGRWPWPREIHALVIERLFEAGARMVAIDIVFAADLEGDDLLAATVAKYRDRIVLASILQVRDGLPTFFYPNTNIRSGLGEDAIGYAKVNPDPVDDTVRTFHFRTSELREGQVPGFEDDDTGDLQSFAAVAVSKMSGDPVPWGYHELINYQGPADTYKPVPVEQIFVKRLFEQGSRYEQGNIFRDKLVFYGPIAEVLHDIHRTPFGMMPGVEIHAQLAASLWEKQLLERATPTFTFVLTLLFALGAALAVLFIRNAVWQALVVVAWGAIYWIATQTAFTQARVWVPAIPALFCIVTTGGLGVVFLFFLEQWEKAHTRKVLNRFVSKRIAAVILKNAEDFEHGRQGERRPVAVLFSDIRSFTTWSENAAPEHLVGQLNEYFERMVTHIEDTEGNAQKFIGDAILAAWGDTHSNGPAEDVRRAVATALKMRVTLRELNAGWAGRDDRLVISIGIGINYGDVVVGEVGHPERREYTVLGDGVNFAARLESATKQFHTDFLVGESVEALTREQFVFRHVDFIRVKGKKKPVNVYIPLSDRSVPAPPWLAEYHRARALYVERKFTEAAALFREVNAQIGGDDFLCANYADRCDRYAQQPPPADWDGSYTLTEK